MHIARLRPHLTRGSPNNRFLASRGNPHTFSRVEYSAYILKSAPISQLVSRRSKTSESHTYNVPPAADLFSYTSGRFLFNERLRLQERYVEFDIKELQAAAYRALGSIHDDVIHMSKLAEGSFNRVFLLRMRDGFEMIAKIPYPLAGPAFYATASEAATMSFLRSKGIPIPEVYGYCARADNPVQSEYILMEKATGVSATTRWMDMSTKDMMRLAQSIVELETKLFALPFAAIGSLYFKRDLPENEQTSLYASDDIDSDTKTFCIGPTADYMFRIGRRASLNLDRGPWTDPVAYMQAIARKEITWTQNYGKVREVEFPYNAMDSISSVQHPEEFIRSLNDYLALTPHLLPRDPSHDWNRPTIRHPDLTPANILIDPQTCRVVSLIDWQHTVNQPRILAAGHAPAFQNPEPMARGDLIEPQLPENFSEIPVEEQAAVQDFHRRLILFYYYRVFTGGLNHLHHRAVVDKMLPTRNLLVDYAGRQWCGNNYTLRGAIVRTAQRWHLLPDVKDTPCPISLDDTAALERFEKEEAERIATTLVQQHWRERVCNMSEDGWVRNEDYDQAKKELGDIKQEAWKMCDGDANDERAFESGWPWRDHEEED